jgi:hypothetical protein
LRAVDQFFGAGFDERLEGMFDLGWQLEGFAQNAPTLLTTMDDTLGNLIPNQYCIYENSYNLLTGVAQQFSVNYDSATGLFGIIKPSSG